MLVNLTTMALIYWIIKVPNHKEWEWVELYSDSPLERLSNFTAGTLV